MKNELRLLRNPFSVVAAVCDRHALRANSCFFGAHRAPLQEPKFPRAMAVAVMVLTTILPFTGCSSKNDNNAQTSSVTASNVTLTAEQRQKIQFYIVAAAKFHKTTETTGTVDFDNDQATSVLAPFGGPVSRLLVSPGDKVKAGDPLAEVDSPDFAAAISAYRKALATAQTLRRVADMDKDLIQHNGWPSAKKNRPKPTPPTPRRIATPRCKPSSR